MKVRRHLIPFLSFRDRKRCVAFLWKYLGIHSMKKTLAAATVAALVGVAGAASAADLYKGGSLKDVPVYVPPPLWTGFYIGGHMGIAWSRLDLNDHVMTACDATGLLCNRFPFGKGNLNSTNGFGGGQFGYNFQGGNFLGPNFVYGIEVDLGAVAMRKPPP